MFVRPDPWPSIVTDMDKFMYRLLLLAGGAMSAATCRQTGI